MSETPEQRRRRWISFGELIAVLALIVSALGVWVSWKNDHSGKPAASADEHKPIPLTLRGTVDGNGRVLTIIPADPEHALQSLTVTLFGASPIDVGSDGRLNASDVEAALKGHEKELKDHVYSVRARIAAHYVENGVDRHGGGTYILRYRWEGGGLFGSRSLQLVGLSR
jgi:hypothetical protein